MKLKRGQRLEGRIVSDSSNGARHKKLIELLDSIIERARDSTMMSAEYDAGKIEAMFACGPVEVVLPPNEWTKGQNPTNDDRELMLRFYIQRAEALLEIQGLKVENAVEKK